MPHGGPSTGAGDRWEHFPHVADVGIRGFGSNIGSAFEQAAMAMTAVITDPDTIDHLEIVEITCEEPNAELLLVDWLNSIIYEMAVRKMLFSRFRVELHHNKLSGAVSGEPIDVKRHSPAAEVKGATLSELEVAQGSGGHWRAQCIVDV